jgi:hypothetical protein
MVIQLTLYFREIDVSVVDAVRAHGTVWSGRTDGRQSYRWFRRNLQLFFSMVVDAVWARGMVWYDHTDGRQSYSNLRTSKISMQTSRALMHQYYLENG